MQKFDNLSPIKVVEEMAQMSLRPAVRKELFTFGIVYPELQKQFPIIGLGSYSGTLVQKGKLSNGGLLTDLLDSSFHVPCLSWCIKSSGLDNIDYQYEYPKFLAPSYYKGNIISMEDVLGRTVLYFPISEEGLKNCFYLAVK